MKSLQHLKEVALLGTDKKALDENLLAEEVQSLLKNQKFKDQEDRFLKALGLQYFYDKAGKIPPKFTGELPKSSIEEKQMAASAEMAQVLKRILLIDGQLKELLLCDYMDALIEQSKLIPSQFIIPLLKYGKKCQLDTQHKLYQVVGNKGQWIMKQFDNYSLKTVLKVQGDDVWLHGIAKQRKEYFEHRRKKDIEKANQLLASTWTEESIREKLSFLSIIKLTLHEKDQAFLEGLLKKEFAYHAKEKKMTKACRKTIVECLLGLPTSKLFKQTIKQLKKYVNRKNELAIPEKEDKFWNAANMVATYALEEENEDIGQFKSDQLYWLSFFVENIPIKFWKELLSRDIKETLDHFLNDRQFQLKVDGKYVSNLLPSVYALAFQHKELELLMELLKHPNYTSDEAVNSLIKQHKLVVPSSTDTYNLGEQLLLEALNPANWEEYLLAIIKAEWVYNYNMLSTWKSQNGEWSIEFSNAWINKIYRLLKLKTGTPNYRVGILAAHYFNSGSLDLLKAINEKKGEALGRSQKFWKEYIFGPILEGAEIRALIKQNMPT